MSSWQCAIAWLQQAAVLSRALAQPASLMSAAHLTTACAHLLRAGWHYALYLQQLPEVVQTLQQQDA